MTITYVCTQASCGAEFEEEETDGDMTCQVCGAPAERKPPAPDGELKPIRP